MQRLFCPYYNILIIPFLSNEFMFDCNSLKVICVCLETPLLDSLYSDNVYYFLMVMIIVLL